MFQLQDIFGTSSVCSPEPESQNKLLGSSWEALCTHKMAIWTGLLSAVTENISSAKKARYKPQNIQSTEAETCRNLPNRLRWLTPAGKVLVGTVLLKTFWSEARKPIALNWHTSWPAKRNCKKILSSSWMRVFHNGAILDYKQRHYR